GVYYGRRLFPSEGAPDMAVNMGRCAGRLRWGGLVCLLAMAAVGPGGRADRKPAPKLSPLKVVGTQVQNGKKERVRLRGVNAACLEWTSNGEGHILDTVKAAVEDWHVNIIRLPLSQDRWFGKAPEQTDEGVAYRALVK